jgi:hypothetical protein
VTNKNIQTKQNKQTKEVTEAEGGQEVVEVFVRP